MCRLRSVRRSVFLDGDSGRGDLTLRRRRLRVGGRSVFGRSRRGRSVPFGSFGVLDLSCRFRCTLRVPFFGSRRRRVLGNTSFIAGSAGGFALFPHSSFGTSGGDKRDARHRDPVPLRHELGQGWSAAESDPDAIVNTILQPRPYLQNSEDDVSK
jgi:hypothetical protein